MAELVAVEFNPFKKSTTPDDFAARYGSAAEKAGKALGVDPKSVLGQWGLETGWGKSVIPGTNNLGNIKDFAGGGVAATDNMTGSRDKYRAYESPDQFVDDYVSLIQRKYPNAVNAKTPEDFARALKSGGYAEDPGYVSKVATAAKMTPVKGGTEALGYGNRPDGSPKGSGFLGELQRPDGGVSTEVSVGVNIGGKEMDIPLLVPTLSRAEIDQVLSLPQGQQPPESIVRKAAQFAKQRIAKGRSVFAEEKEQTQAAGPKLVPVDFNPFAAAKPGGAEGSWDEEPKAAFGVFPKARRNAENNQPDALGSMAKGVASGFADVGNTIINSGTKAAAGAIPAAPNALINPALQRAGGQPSAAELQNAERVQGLQNFNAENQGPLFSGGRIAGNIAATLPVGGVLGGVAKAAGMPVLGNALASGGMVTGAKTAPGLAAGAADMGTRMLGGGITGGAVAGLIDPNAAATGAAVGAALPPAVKALGALGGAAGRVVRGPEVPEGIRTAAAAAREAGYVIPPTQVRPTLGNRLLEGTAGKLTTAQNASAANQQVTNRLARQAIGADELTPEALQVVRDRANDAYSALGRAGEFTADDAFREALKKVGAPSAQLQKDFPALANSELTGLVKSFGSTQQFDSQSAIEAIKVMRAAQRASVGAQDPSAVALGRAQGKIANALEDLVERNLAASGQRDLLASYRDARQTLAKVYDLEKALNPASGNVDAKKVANLLRKGRLTGELKQIGEFGGSFPKAAQTLENMGSLPQTSPLDWTAAGGIAAATGGSPLAALGLFARPAARSAALSPMVQNRLAQPAALPMLTQSARRNLLQPLYRGGPVLGTDR